MQNISKVLLIAGSLFIVIVLIAAGMRLFNSTSGTTDSVEQTMSGTEIATFNNRILPYIGDDIKTTDAIELLKIIMSNNSTNTRKIEVSWTVFLEGDKLTNREVSGDNELDSIEKINKCITNLTKSNIKDNIQISILEYNNGYIKKIKLTNRKNMT